MISNRQPDDRDEIDPLVDVDNARERPRRLEKLADQPDTGGLTDNPTDTAIDYNSYDDDDDPADIVPGDDEAIYERGTIIMPPS